MSAAVDGSQLPLTCCEVRNGRADRAGTLSPVKQNTKSRWEQSTTGMTMLLSQILEALAQQQAFVQELRSHQEELASLVRQRHEVLGEKIDSRISELFQHLQLPARVPRVETERAPDFGTPNFLRPTKSKRMSAVQPYPTKQDETDTSGKTFQPLLHRIRRVICSPGFDAAMCAVIVVNICVMSVHYQWKGLATAYALGLREDDPGWARVEGVFYIIESAFNVFYIFEMLLRIWAYRWAYLTVSNLMDAAIVAATSSDSFVLHPLNVTSTNLVAMRVGRLVRIFRVLRVLRLMNIFEEMRILLRTFAVSIRSLLWSVLFLAGIIVGVGLVMVQLTTGIVEDEVAGLETRKWVHGKFGTSSSAVYTIFEATFTTAWPGFARPMIEEVDAAWALFWVPFVVVVNFAVMRIIAALFLKQTMAVAALDAERVAMEKMHQRELFAESLAQVFKAGDTSGDGMISRAEFETMLENEDVVACFRKLELEMEEVEALFNVLSADDGQADYGEFLAGALKMKCSVRTIDAVQILHGQVLLSRGLKQVWDTLQHLSTSLGSPVTQKQAAELPEQN